VSPFAASLDLPSHYLDSTPPTLDITGATPALGTADPNSAVANATFPLMRADDNTKPEEVTIACTAVLKQGEAKQAVASGLTVFPYGTTAVTCIATDAVGLTSAPVAFAVVVACGSGYSVRAPGGTCQSERSWGRRVDWAEQCGSLLLMRLERATRVLPMTNNAVNEAMGFLTAL
jgi:hypothetical protein